MTAVSTGPVVSHHVGKRSINGVSVDADHPHSLFDQPQPQELLAEAGRLAAGARLTRQQWLDVVCEHIGIAPETLEQGEDLTADQLHAPLEKALRENHLIPICFVSATSGVGISELLDIFAKLMPTPNEGNPPVFLNGKGEATEEIKLTPDPQKHALAHVFKVGIDPFVGRLGIFRIHQGTVTKDSQLFVGEARKPFKVSHLLKLQGKDTSEIDAGIQLGVEIGGDIQYLITEEEADRVGMKFFRESGVYPIGHVMTIRDDVLAANPWVGPAMFRAFLESKDHYMAGLDAKAEPSKRDAQAIRNREIYGGDPFPMGLEANRKSLEGMIKIYVEQRIIPASIEIDGLCAVKQNVNIKRPGTPAPAPG